MSNYRRVSAACRPYGGHWHDADMLLVGEHEGGGLPGVTLEEGKTQFGMWSMMVRKL